MKAVISGYGRMGHMVEGVLHKQGIEIAAATEDVCSIDPALAKQCVVIDFTTPDAFKASAIDLSAILPFIVLNNVVFISW